MSHARGLLLGLSLGLSMLGSPRASAIPAPMPKDRLNRMASDIVEGRILSTKLVDVVRSAPYRVTRYESLVRVYHVVKGRLKPGAVIRFHWILEAWIGQGRRPPGRTPRPYFGVCDHLRLYLGGGTKGIYALAYYNGWKRLSGGLGKAPTRRGATLRCPRHQLKRRP